MKKLILEVLSLYQEEVIIEELLKKYLYVKQNKDGNLIFKFVKGENVMTFNPSNEEELDLLYDKLFYVVKLEIEINFGKNMSTEVMNTKRIYTSIENIVDSIIKRFKTNRSNKKLDNLVYKLLYNKLNFRRGAVGITEYIYYSNNLIGLSDNDVNNLLKDSHITNDSVNVYKNVIRKIYKIISEELYLSYRESKNGIIKAVDDLVKNNFNTNKNISDNIRSKGFFID